MALMNFVSRNLPAISAAWLNAVDVLKFTVFGDATTKAGARTALELDSQVIIHGIDSGAANAAIVTITVSDFAPIVGSRVAFTAAATNTGAATLNVAGLGAAPILDQAGNPCTGGELSRPVTVEWTGTAWRIVAGGIPLGNKRTNAETIAGVIPTNYNFASHDSTGEVCPHRYGAVGDGVVDDTTAFRTSTTVINTLGSGVLRGIPGSNYRIFTGAITGSLCIFTNLRGIAVLGYGCMLTVDLTRVITVSMGYIFKFDNCTNIKVDGWETDGPPPDVTQTLVKGWEFVHCENGCRNVDMPNNRVKHMIAGLICQNQTGDLSLTSAARVRNVHIGILDTFNCFYGVNTQHSGDGLYIDRLTTDTVHRSLFINGGMQEVRANVWAKNAFAIDVFITNGASGINLYDVKVDYHSDQDSIHCGSAERIQLCYGSSIPATMSNIHIFVDVKFADAAGLAPGEKTGAGVFRLFKRLDATGTEDNAVRGHVLDNFSLSGVVKGLPSDTGIGLVTGTSLSGVWGPGDFFRNIKLSDLVLDANGQTGVDNHVWHLGACVDNITVRNIDATGYFIVREDQQNSGRVWPRAATMIVENVRALNRWVRGPLADQVALDHQGFGSNVTLSNGWSGKTLTNVGAGSGVIYTLPPAIVGTEFKFARALDFPMQIDPDGSETIGTGTAGQLLQLNAAGNFVHIKCFVDGQWTQISTVGATSYI